MPEFRTAAILRNDDDDDWNSDRRWSSLISIDPEDEAPEDEAPEDEAPEDEAPEDEAPEDEAPEDEAPEEGGPVGDNPGNDKGVGGAGENPTDDDGWGEGDRGRSGQYPNPQSTRRKWPLSSERGHFRIFQSICLADSSNCAHKQT